MAEHEGTMGEMGGTEASESRVKEAAHGAQEKVSDMAATVREKTGELAEEGKERAQELVHRAGDRARSRADEERTRLAGGIRTVADALRRGTDDLTEDRQAYGRFVEALADRADGLSRYLEEHDVDEMAREARRFAREHTGVVVGSAFALGLLGARFLKSSGGVSRPDGGSGAPERYGAWSDDGGYETVSGYGAARGYDRPGGYSRGEVHHAGHAGANGDLSDREDRLEHGGDGLGNEDIDLDEGRMTDRPSEPGESGGIGGPGGAHA